MLIFCFFSFLTLLQTSDLFLRAVSFLCPVYEILSFIKSIAFLIGIYLNALLCFHGKTSFDIVSVAFVISLCESHADGYFQLQITIVGVQIFFNKANTNTMLIQHLYMITEAFFLYNMSIIYLSQFVHSSKISICDCYMLAFRKQLYII